MKNPGKKTLCTGMLLLALFAIWTVSVMTVDVRIAGETGKRIGFATVNCWFHQLTGVHMAIYTVTDWLGLVPLFVCLLFAFLGLAQLIQRKSLLKVDRDLILLGFYYVLVIAGYLVFEMHPINYRPIFIDGRLEASYPSSTTLLVLSVMPTLVFQVRRRTKNLRIRRTVQILSPLFSLAMVIGRLVSGVHWLTDIAGSVLLSAGLFLIYAASVQLSSERKSQQEVL